MVIVACTLGGPKKPPVAPTTSVLVALPGASPAEVDASVLRTLEAALTGMPGVAHLRGTSTEGSALLTIVFEPGVDRTEARADVSSTLAEVTSLPADAEAPVILPPTPRERLVLVVREPAADVLRARLVAMPGVTSVASVGHFVEEVVVELEPKRLLAIGLNPADVLGAQDPSDLLIRPAGNADTAETVGRRLIRPGLQVRDVATLRIERTPERARVQWKQDSAVLLWVGLTEPSPTELSAAISEVGALALDPSHRVALRGESADLGRAAAAVAASVEGAPVVELGQTTAHLWFADLGAAVLGLRAAEALPGITVQPSSAHPAELILVGPELLTGEARALLETDLSSRDGVAFVHPELPAQPEMSFQIDRERAGALGVTIQDVMQSVRLHAGMRSGAVTYRWAGEPDLRELQVVTADKQAIPLTALGSISVQQSPPSVERFDGHTVQVVRIDRTTDEAVIGLDGLPLPTGWSALAVLPLPQP